MTMTTTYAAEEPRLSDIQARSGALLLEFGAPWCGVCRGTQPALAAAMADFPELPHLKVEDGPGRPLGRSFRVKLWPTLVLLIDGQEIGRLVRPTGRDEVAELLAQSR